MKLQKMAAMVRQTEKLVSQKIKFVESYPLTNLFDENVAELLKQADILVASQVSYTVHVYIDISTLSIVTNKVSVSILGKWKDWLCFNCAKMLSFHS